MIDRDLRNHHVSRVSHVSLVSHVSYVSNISHVSLVSEFGNARSLVFYECQRESKVVWIEVLSWSVDFECDAINFAKTSKRSTIDRTRTNHLISVA